MTDSTGKLLSEVRSGCSWLAYRRAATQIRNLSDPAKTLRVAFAGSFTIEPLVDYCLVEAAADAIGLETYVASYGQFSQEILNSASGLYAFKPDLTILAVEPEALAQDPLAAADQLLSLLGQWKTNAAGTLIVCNFMETPDWPFHVLQSERFIQLRRANQRLADAFAGDAQVQLCDLHAAAAWVGYANAGSPEMMAMARIPFSEVMLKTLAQRICSHIKAIKGLAQKCLVLDCDNTLWGGIIGEDGLDGISLGPDWPGREFVEFQKAILELHEQGVILAINSKNNESDVLEVLRRHPHMILREDHFGAMVINWNNKVDNMKIIADQLNIGPDSMVFADDNPAERQLMRQFLSQVKILELPSNPALFATSLRQTSFFTKSGLSEEDRQRGRMYAAQRRRNELQDVSVTLDDFLKSLEMICAIRPASLADIKRAAQLTQRTNQFNLTTRRYTEADVRAMLDSSTWNAYVLGLKDKFGDNGIVGLALVEKTNESWRIDTFLMSCRVIGRQAEEAMLDRICRDAVACGIRRLDAEYIRTAKNALAADFWDKMHFPKISATDTSSVYALDLKDYQPRSFKYLAFEQE